MTVSAPHPAPTVRAPARRGPVPLLPGLGLTVIGGGLALAIAAALPGVSPLVLALLMGAVASRTLDWLSPAHRILPLFAPGARAVATHVLRAGVVLLGLRLSLPSVLALGWRGLMVVATTLIVTFVVVLGAGRRLKVGRAESLLVATGFAVCGAAAISAMSGVLPQGRRQRVACPAAGPADPCGIQDAHGIAENGGEGETSLSESVAVAVALVTLLGLVLVPVLPWLAGRLGMDAHQSGLWIGAAMPEVAHVVMAGDLAGSGVLEVATVSKLARVALLAPLVAMVAIVVSRRARTLDTAGAAAGDGARRPPPMPLFLLGFIGCVALRSTGLVPHRVLGLADTLTTALFAAAMFALGWGIDLQRIWQSAKPAALLGVLATVIAALVSGVLVLALG